MSLRAIIEEEYAQREQKAVQQAVQQGIQQTLKTNIISILEKRFQQLPANLINKINQLQDTNKLEQLVLETISVNSVAEFENLING